MKQPQPVAQANINMDESIRENWFQAWLVKKFKLYTFTDKQLKGYTVSTFNKGVQMGVALSQHMVKKELGNQAVIEARSSTKH